MDAKKIKVMTEKQKYNYFVTLLEKIENSKLYQGQEINENPELESKRQRDIDQLNELISVHLINDGIKMKIIGDRKLIPKYTDKTIGDFDID